MRSQADAIYNLRFRLSRLFASRVFVGASANAYGQAATLIIQFATVPMLLLAWGAPTFGLWLVISAIPSYLALVDFGFSVAAANDMTMAMARGAGEEACGTFQSVLALNVIVSICVSAIVLVVIVAVPNRFVPQSDLIASADVRIVWFLQTLQVLATLCCGAFSGGFLSSGHYSLGSFLGSSARLLENVALVAGALIFHGFLPAASLMLAARLAGLLGIAAVLMRIAPWLSLGFGRASRSEIRRLAGPALATTALPAAFAVSLQGFVLVVGATLSLDAVATFSTLRTLTRSIIQAGSIVNHAVMPEVTRAFGGRDSPRIRSLIRVNLISVIALNTTAFAGIAIFGPWVVDVWTRGRIQPDPIMLIGLAAVASLHGFWLSQANLLLAVNRHAVYSYWFLLVSFASVIASVPAARALGIHGLLLPLLIAECVMALVMARAFHRTFGGKQLDSLM